jgi:hypothetical protein
MIAQANVRMPASGAAQPIASADSTSVVQLVTLLRDSLYPSQREWACEKLAQMNWRAEPQVVDALVTGAKSDPAVSVRVCCIRSLAQMKIQTVPVVAAVQELKMDPESRIRHEADQAMVILMADPAHQGDPGIQPASYRK